ncbi:MAG TPA: hypothetical protein PK765_03730 [bacterium]|nr:hypothetical protein [bacterium]
MRFIRRLLTLFILLGLVFAPVFAGATDLSSPSFTFSPSYLQVGDTEYSDGIDNVENFIVHIANIILVGVAVLAAIGVIVAGFMLILSGGDSSQANQAKQIITYNIIAIVMALFSYSIIQLVSWLLTAE